MHMKCHVPAYSSAGGVCVAPNTPNCRRALRHYVDERTERLIRNLQCLYVGFDVELLLARINQWTYQIVTAGERLRVARDIRHATRNPELRVLDRARSAGDSAHIPDTT